MRFGADGSVATLFRKPSGFMVHEARDGSVWIAFRDEYRLVRYYQGVSPIYRYRLSVARQLAAHAASRVCVLTMAEDTNGELLLLTPAGLVRTVGGRLSSAEALPLPANTGELPKVRSLLVDREGNRWVGTDCDRAGSFPAEPP